MAKRRMNPEVARSVVWLDELAKKYNMSYEELLEGARQYLKDGDSFCVGGMEALNAETPQEFWDHYMAVTGEEVEDDKQSDFFHCSC